MPAACKHFRASDRSISMLYGAREQAALPYLGVEYAWVCLRVSWFFIQATTPPESIRISIFDLI
jgi:hypothetical protein